jgi:hypothetical protein
MTNLMIHCGAHKVEEPRVRNAATPLPTETHFPIPHKTLLDETLRLVGAHGLEVVNAAHALHGDDSKYFGLLEVAPKASAAPARLAMTGGDGASHTDGAIVKPDHATIIGLRNSHDKSFAAGLVVGSQVFVCDNLAFSGEVTMRRAHTKHIMRDLPALLEAAMGKLMGLRNHQEHRIQAYKDADLGSRDAHDLIIRGLRAGVVPSSRVIKVVNEWEKPSHEEFEPRTVWSLFNAFTEVGKARGAIFDKPRVTQALHGLMDSAAGVAPLALGTTEEVDGGEVEVAGVVRGVN